MNVVGRQEQMESVAIGPEDDMERRRRDIVDAAAVSRQPSFAFSRIVVQR